MAESSASHRERLMGGLFFGYLGQALTIFLGLVVTRFIVSLVPVREYGIWLAALQVATYGNLLDFGVLMLLPRNVATLKELPDPAQRNAELNNCAATAVRAVLLQTLWLLAGGLVVYVFLGATGRPPDPLLAGLAVAVILSRPFRVFHAILDGFQEFAPLGKIGIGSQLAASAVTISLLLAGTGMLGILAGWIAGQCFSVIAWYKLLLDKHPLTLEAMLTAPRGGTWHVPLRTGWLQSMQQLAQLLISGTDLVLVGSMLGPAAVPVYSCTVRAATFLNNLPGIIMNLFLPTLASLRVSRSNEQLGEILKVLTLAMVGLGGIIALGVIGFNKTFVNLWLGPAFFGGEALSFLSGLYVILRQTSSVLAVTAFSWGQERATARSAIFEAIAFFAFALLGLRILGVAGLPLASVLALILVRMPIDFAAVTKAVPDSFPSILGALQQSFGAFLLSCSLLIFAVWWRPEDNVIRSCALVIAEVIFLLSLLYFVRAGKLMGYFPARVRSALAFLNKTSTTRSQGDSHTELE